MLIGQLISICDLSTFLCDGRIYAAFRGKSGIEQWVIEIVVYIN